MVVWPDSDPSAEARRLIEERDRWLEAASSAPITAEGGTVRLSETRPAADWQQVVADASAAIRDGQAEKIVLAREVRLQSETPFDVSYALQRLVAAYPTCYVFAFGHGEKTFLGATPERLVHVEDGDLEAACLAGSERRGATPEEDRELGEALLASAKDREEHAIVVRALRDGLSGLCDQLIAPDEPELLSVSNVHHLFTPISARLRAGVCILDAVERLHPTPAVGGYPRETALAFIREHEGMDRGWYASPIGWVGPDGGGEFAVALRSGLVDGSTAFLFAGCGIMGDSDPRREYDESWLKFRPMLSALGGELR
ncbi:MAG: isochorismate synthase [Nitrolancea sp.]